jgi:hypothetical protein
MNCLPDQDHLLLELSRIIQFRADPETGRTKSGKIGQSEPTLRRGEWQAIDSLPVEVQHFLDLLVA